MSVVIPVIKSKFPPKHNEIKCKFPFEVIGCNLIEMDTLINNYEKYYDTKRKKKIIIDNNNTILCINNNNIYNKINNTPTDNNKIDISIKISEIKFIYNNNQDKFEYTNDENFIILNKNITRISGSGRYIFLHQLYYEYFKTVNNSILYLSDEFKINPEFDDGYPIDCTVTEYILYNISRYYFICYDIEKEINILKDIKSNKEVAKTERYNALINCIKQNIFYKGKKITFYVNNSYFIEHGSETKYDKNIEIDINDDIISIIDNRISFLEKELKICSKRKNKNLIKKVQYYINIFKLNGIQEQLINTFIDKQEIEYKFLLRKIELCNLILNCELKSFELIILINPTKYLNSYEISFLNMFLSNFIKQKNFKLIITDSCEELFNKLPINNIINIYNTTVNKEFTKIISVYNTQPILDNIIYDTKIIIELNDTRKYYLINYIKQKELLHLAYNQLCKIKTLDILYLESDPFNIKVLLREFISQKLKITDKTLQYEYYYLFFTFIKYNNTTNKEIYVNELSEENRRKLFIYLLCVKNWDVIIANEPIISVENEFVDILIKQLNLFNGVKIIASSNDYFLKKIKTNDTSLYKITYDNIITSKLDLNYYFPPKNFNLSQKKIINDKIEFLENYEKFLKECNIVYNYYTKSSYKSEKFVNINKIKIYYNYISNLYQFYDKVNELLIQNFNVNKYLYIKYLFYRLKDIIEIKYIYNKLVVLHTDYPTLNIDLTEITYITDILVAFIKNLYEDVTQPIDDSNKICSTAISYLSTTKTNKEYETTLRILINNYSLIYNYDDYYNQLYCKNKLSMYDTYFFNLFEDLLIINIYIKYYNNCLFMSNKNDTLQWNPIERKLLTTFEQPILDGIINKDINNINNIDTKDITHLNDILRNTTSTDDLISYILSLENDTTDTIFSQLSEYITASIRSS